MSRSVSVVIPTRDRRSLLERKLHALEGEVAPFEVIVVADACSDDTEAFLEAYQPPYRLRWRRGPGLHAATARNLGAEVADGEILLFSDDDVIAPVGWVAENRELHEASGRVGLSKQRLPDHLTRGDALSAVHGWWNTNGRSTSVAAELFHQVGGYDPQFSTYGGEDPDLGYRLMLAGARFVFLSRITVEHWDERYGTDMEKKGCSAGRAHVAVWRKHGDPRIAWALGIHPLMLALKRPLFAPWTRPLLGADRWTWERAYAEGARQALQGR